MVKFVLLILGEVDVVLFMINVDEWCGVGDNFIIDCFKMVK